MKLCIIGASGHYSYALNVIKGRQDDQVIGIAPGSDGESTEPLERALAAYGIRPRRYDDYRKMLDEQKPDIAVINPYFCDNAKVTLEVLKRGIHAFVEKPVATTWDDLDAVIDAYNKASVHLAAMLGIRYSAHFLTAWQSVRQGSIGEIRLMNAQKSYKLGKRSDFFKKRDTYGGTIPWVGSHAIDWLRWFSGREFRSVFASHSSLYNQGHGELEVTALCQFIMDDEVLGSVTIDYLRPQNAPTHDDDRIRLVGTNGILEVRNGKAFLLNDETNGQQELPLLPEGNIFADFMRQVRNEGNCLVSAEDSFAVTRACLKARISADCGKVIYW